MSTQKEKLVAEYSDLTSEEARLLREKISVYINILHEWKNDKYIEIQTYHYLYSSLRERLDILNGIINNAILKEITTFVDS